MENALINTDIYLEILIYILHQYITHLGAHNANLDSILITGDGIHKKALEITKVLNNKIPEKTGTNSNSLHENGKNVEIDDIKNIEKSLLMKVCDLCDEEGTPRPTFILEHCTF